MSLWDSDNLSGRPLPPWTSYRTLTFIKSHSEFISTPNPLLPKAAHLWMVPPTPVTSQTPSTALASSLLTPADPSLISPPPVSLSPLRPAPLLQTTAPTSSLGSKSRQPDSRGYLHKGVRSWKVEQEGLGREEGGGCRGMGSRC